MRRQPLIDLLERQPRPIFRFHLTNGTVFEVNNPDLAVVRRHTLDLLLPSDSSGLREAVIDLFHIMWVEVVTPPS
jgi:hypothetical protein